MQQDLGALFKKKESASNNVLSVKNPLPDLEDPSIEIIEMYKLDNMQVKTNEVNQGIEAEEPKTNIKIEDQKMSSNQKLKNRLKSEQYIVFSGFFGLADFKTPSGRFYKDS